MSLIDWTHIDTVLLDMDGTLLDLSFDNWFAPGRYTLEGEVRHPGAGRQVMASSEQAAGFVVTGSRTGGGMVDVPHAFSLWRAGTEAEQLT